MYPNFSEYKTLLKENITFRKFLNVYLREVWINGTFTIPSAQFFGNFKLIPNILNKRKVLCVEGFRINFERFSLKKNIICTGNIVVCTYLRYRN